LKIGSKLFALVVSSVLLVAVVATNLQQASAFGFVERQQFKKLTHEFEKNVINAVKDESAGPAPYLRELLTAYVDDVNKIFLGGPDMIPPLIQNYEREVTTLIDSIPPPDGDKQVGIAFMQNFKKVSDGFEKAVIGLINPPDPD
jgi:hypothetical protein